MKKEALVLAAAITTASSGSVVAGHNVRDMRPIYDCMDRAGLSDTDGDGRLIASIKKQIAGMNACARGEDPLTPSESLVSGSLSIGTSSPDRYGHVPVEPGVDLTVEGDECVGDSKNFCPIAGVATGLNRDRAFLGVVFSTRDDIEATFSAGTSDEYGVFMRLNGKVTLSDANVKWFYDTFVGTKEDRAITGIERSDSLAKYPNIKLNTNIYAVHDDDNKMSYGGGVGATQNVYPDTDIGFRVNHDSRRGGSVYFGLTQHF